MQKSTIAKTLCYIATIVMEIILPSNQFNIILGCYYQKNTCHLTILPLNGPNICKSHSFLRTLCCIATVVRECDENGSLLKCASPGGRGVDPGDSDKKKIFSVKSVPIFDPFF